MKTYLDCIPCFIRQALNAARLVSTDPAVHEQVLREALRWACELDMNQPAPIVGQRLHRRLREIIGSDDLYREAKERQNSMAMRLLDELRAEVQAAADPLAMAARLAIAGNVIDMGVNGNVTEAHVREAIHQVLHESFMGDEDLFRQAAANARRILYLADNAGEIAFDRLLIEQLSPERVIVAVRGAPVLNDATLADARAVGLHEIVELIDNGSDAPGTLLDDCSPEFKRRFAEADLIIAKGQGNYETLSDVPARIFFLFKVKCPVVAEHVSAPLGMNLLMQSAAGFKDEKQMIL
ncbi:DUF89 family protein [Candidatus Sumerlaeota bacterium]|nr:DUF89 family protein [Candidatus Sumerlaeota bacterium]